jgi:nitroreductase
MMTQTIHGFSYEELMVIDENVLRALLHERTHHTIEVFLYRVLQGKRSPPIAFGEQAQQLLKIWESRNLAIDSSDIQWCRQLIEIANRVTAGEHVKISTQIPEAFSTREMTAVKKLLYERRSIRQFTDRPISDEMLQEILSAGLMAPQGCNVSATRFILLRDPEEWRLIRSDIPIEAGMIIVVCLDLRIYQALRFDELVPQNLYFDAAAVADHMCLMAHALGLGACWLTHGKESQRRLQESLKLPETVVTQCHLIIGWPNEAPIKSQRMRVQDAVLYDGKKRGTNPMHD